MLILGQFSQTPGGFQDIDVTQLLVLLSILLLLGAIFVFSIVVICLNFSAIKRAWRMGLVVSFVVLFFTVSTYAITLSLRGMEQFDELRANLNDPPLALILMFMVLLLGVLSLLQAGWYVLVFCAGVGEWDRARLPGYALLMRGERSAWKGIGLGALFGTFAGVVSTVVLVWLGIGIGPMLVEFAELMGHIDRLAWPYRLALYSLMVVGPAITEELAFRGLMLGFLLRIGGDRRWLAVLSIVFVSFLWSLLHIPNTDMPVVKCLQIFLIGLVLGELARRRGMEAAIAGHVMLNVSAVVCSLPMG